MVRKCKNLMQVFIWLSQEWLGLNKINRSESIKSRDYWDGGMVEVHDMTLNEWDDQGDFRCLI